MVIRALVHGGGGNKGAWGCGVLKYLLGDLKIDYSISCGVSVGAINVSYLSQFSSGQETQAIQKLCDLWLELNTNKIYKRWFPFGVLHAPWKSSMYDSSPLHKLIKEHIKLDTIRNSGKQINVGTVNLNTGKYHNFDQSSDYLIEAIIGSASFPVMFSPVEFLGQLWSDGGSKQITPLKTAIDMGADVIDVIVTSPQTRVKRFIEKPSIIDILKRSIDLPTDKIMANDLDKVEMYNKLAHAGVIDKKVVKVNIIRPDFNLTDDLLDFTPAKIKEMMEKGYNDAAKKFEL